MDKYFMYEGKSARVDKSEWHSSLRWMLTFSVLLSLGCTSRAWDRWCLHDILTKLNFIQRHRLEEAHSLDSLSGKFLKLLVSFSKPGDGIKYSSNAIRSYMLPLGNQMWQPDIELKYEVSTVFNVFQASLGTNDCCRDIGHRNTAICSYHPWFCLLPCEFLVD